MPTGAHRPARGLASTLAAFVASVLVGVVAVLLPVGPASASNVVTPGNFTGYGFDQCTAPTQAAMDAWLSSSPYWSVGIYISGDSRYCTEQPNLTPAWVDTQLANGWRLLPITLGPQAWCTTRQRYLKQVRISPDDTDGYAKARAQGRAEASKTVSAAKALGMAARSTMWYDIEAFDISRTKCRESALSFLSAWTRKLHKLHYVSGIYSSGASGIKMLDDAQTNRPGKYTMPDQIWIGDWNGVANVSSKYLRPDSWLPGGRVHQYRGGHDETHGGVTINIDNDFLDLGTGSVARRTTRHCGGVDVDFANYPTVRAGTRSPLVSAAKCLLTERGLFSGSLSQTYGPRLARAVNKYRIDNGLSAGPDLTRRTWMVLTTEGSRPLVKYGAASSAVRRLQRALNAAAATNRLEITGTFERTTMRAVKAYQKTRGLRATGVVTDSLWALIHAGRR
jgi:hypothetical protein